jgi:hypothetical protein
MVSDIDDMNKANLDELLEGRKKNAYGGRIGLKPGGIVEPGVTHYARTTAEIKADAFRTGVPRKDISEWTPQQRANLKTWMKNTGSTLEDYNKKPNEERFRIRRGHSLGLLEAEEPKKLANIKAWEKNTGLKFKDVKDPVKITRIRTGITTGVQVGKLTEAEKAANIKAWEKYTGLKYKDLDKERQSGVRLGKTKGTREILSVQQSLERSVWLKNYTFDDLKKDLKSGKTKNQIAEDLYEKSPEYFDNLQKTRKPKQSVLNNIKTAVGGRIFKKQDLLRLNELNEKNFLAREKLALKDVKNFIEKNQDAYKKVYASNKIGAVSNFREKVLDFMSKKYPEFIKRSKGGQNILSGQRVFTPYRLTERTAKGQYSLDVGLKKDIRKALNIPERPLAGEGMTIPRLQRSYNKNLLSLVKIARDKNIIPKSIDSESKYFNYLKKTQIDPIRNLFGKKFNFGQEHLGGISRAVVVNDAESLAKITAIDPVVNRWVKGTQYDKRISSLMKLAKQSSGETAKGYIDSMNKLITESDEKFGLNQTKYKIAKDKIIPIQPKASLEDSLYKKAQRALKTFVATKRFKDPNFKLLPEELKKAVNFLKEGDVLKSNQFLKTAIRKGGAASVILLGAGAALNTLTAPAEAGETGVAEKVKSWPIEHPWLTGGATVGATAATKPGRKLLGKAFRTLGTPLAGPLWAGWTAADNLKSGKSLTESVVDPWVGMELMFPKMFKENVSKITKNPLAQKILKGKFIPGSKFIPGIGTAITLGSVARDSARAMDKESKRIEAIEDPETQALEMENFVKSIKGYYASGGRAGYMGGGITGIRKPSAIAPTGGPQSQGLASTPEYDTYNKEYKWQT